MSETFAIQTALLIDDDAIDRKLYKRVLDRSGVVEQLFLFEGAEDALEFYRNLDRDQVDVIFLDINMPRMNGFEFLEAALQEFGPGFAEIVVVMLTTSLDPGDHERAAQYDVVKGYINKPLKVEDILKVAEVLRNGS